MDANHTVGRRKPQQAIGTVLATRGISADLRTRAWYRTRFRGETVTDLSGFSAKHVLLGVTGGIAAYKACELARAMMRAGADVQVVMTPSATAFVGPMTFQALTGRPVRIELLDPSAEAGMGHIELARWADLVVIAPCTAHTLATLALGQADDLLTTLWLATRAHRCVAPAMNQQMWSDPSVTSHVERLIARGVHVLGPDSGQQACGDIGPGRLLEVTELMPRLAALLAQGPLSGRHLVITAGPTHEPIDPVRFLSNQASGKMGYALASAAAAFGARVTLVSGPTALSCPRGVTRIDVVTACEMDNACQTLLSGSQVDCFIGAAAVSDMRPATVAQEKLKKGKDNLSTLTLVENPDVIWGVAHHANRPSLVVGFAAETQALLAHAAEKRERKGLDWICANDVSDGQVFGQDTNCLHCLTAAGQVTLGPGTKSEIARQLLTNIATHFSTVKDTACN